MTFDAMSNSPSHSQLNTRKFGRRIWEFIRSHLRLFSRHPCNFSVNDLHSYIMLFEQWLMKGLKKFEFFWPFIFYCMI